MASLVVLLAGLALLPFCGARPDAPPLPLTAELPLGVSVNRPAAMDGYALLYERYPLRVWLADRQGRPAFSWAALSRFANGARPQLRENGNLLMILRDPPRIAEIAPDGRFVWEYSIGGLHNDFQELPNGNLLLLKHDYRSRAEALAAGANPQFVPPEGVALDAVLEVRPTGPESGEVVWRWRAWDWLVQDFDPAKPHYGRPSEHPQRIDLNYNLEALHRDHHTRAGDITHINALSYNAELGQIMLSPRHFSEIWIIEHGGNGAGETDAGGGLLYRWGNPRAYGRETDGGQQLFFHHDAHWIAAGRPGAGHILLFNNGNELPGHQRWHSSVDELALPPSQGRGYGPPAAEGAAWPPPRPVWSYAAPFPPDWYALNRSGAQRLPNGNTFVIDSPHGHLFQVTPQGQIVWRYVNPLLEGGRRLRPGEPAPVRERRITPYGEALILENRIYSARWHPPDYPGLQFLNLTPAAARPDTPPTLPPSAPAPPESPGTPGGGP